MLKDKYPDQESPLPTAGYGNVTKYVLPTVRALFTPPHHHMQFGELGRETMSGKRILRRAGVIMDQYLAALNEQYFDYVFSRRVREDTFTVQHQALTLPGASIKIESPSIFRNSMVPMWRRDESDGCLLI